MKYLLIVILVFIASSSFAAQTGNGKIKILQNAYNGWIFRLDHSYDNPESCDKNVMFLSPSHTQHQEIYSLILTAYTAGKPVTVYTNGCDSNGYIIVKGIYTAWGQ